jgi:retron-type reverse transcriptase
MSQRHRNLIERIAAIDNLREAYRRTRKGKRMTWGYLNFKEYDELFLRGILREVLAGEYRIGPYRQFTIFEPKARNIAALGFRDRLIQHALCNIISPIFERGLMPYTFACRTGMGTHAGVRHVQSMLRHTGATYFLKTDFRKFFPSVDHAVLHRLIEKKIQCRGTLALLREIIPPEGTGLPIGSLTSQLFANVYANPVDRFIHFELKSRHWARYMDDIIILGHDPHELRNQFARMADFAQSHLNLTISKWQVANVSRGINFLGYRIWPRHKLLRKDSVTRAKRKIRHAIEHRDSLGLQAFLTAWSGHASWADTNHLFGFLETHYEMAHC